MTGVKRQETGSRADRARVTRRRIIETAAHLFTVDGYGETTMERVADEAAVAVQTVYYTFGTKGLLLCEVMEFAAAGTHDPIPVHQRSWMVEALNATSARRSLAVTVEHGADIYQRAAPLWPAMNAAAVTEGAVAKYWDGVAAGRRAGMRQLATHLANLGGLHDGLDIETATDVMVVLNSHATFHGLVIESGWSLPTFKGWLYGVLVQQLLSLDSEDSDATTGLSFSDPVEGI